MVAEALGSRTLLVGALRRLDEAVWPIFGEQSEVLAVVESCLFKVRPATSQLHCNLTLKILRLSWRQRKGFGGELSRTCSG